MLHRMYTPSLNLPVLLPFLAPAWHFPWSPVSCYFSHSTLEKSNKYSVSIPATVKTVRNIYLCCTQTCSVVWSEDGFQHCTKYSNEHDWMPSCLNTTLVASSIVTCMTYYHSHPSLTFYSSKLCTHSELLLNMSIPCPRSYLYLWSFLISILPCLFGLWISLWLLYANNVTPAVNFGYDLLKSPKSTNSAITSIYNRRSCFRWLSVCRMDQ